VCFRSNLLKLLSHVQIYWGLLENNREFCFKILAFCVVLYLHLYIHFTFRFYIYIGVHTETLALTLNQSSE
jgi:hypothetical protein